MSPSTVDNIQRVLKSHIIGYALSILIVFSASGLKNVDHIVTLLLFVAIANIAQGYLYDLHPSGPLLLWINFLLIVAALCSSLALGLNCHKAIAGLSPDSPNSTTVVHATKAFCSVTALVIMAILSRAFVFFIAHIKKRKEVLPSTQGIKMH